MASRARFDWGSAMRGRRGLLGARRGPVWLGMALVLSTAAPLQAQTSLGSQRVGTSAGTFLKIPLDARGTAMGGAIAALVHGPASLFVNPAGLGIENERALLLCGVDYITGIPAGGAAVALPFAPIRGALGFALSGIYSEMDETDEYHPLGTGRRFSYNVWTATLGASRALTDKLSFGLAVKAYREGMATEIGGPAATSWLLDAGAVYFVGYRDARIGIAINNFGPDLRPAGRFESRRTDAQIRYSSFSPPTLFRVGFGIDPWRSARWATYVSGEIGHVADNQESFRFGGEVCFDNTLTLRGGYDAGADALKMHGGVGLRVGLGRGFAELDYAYSAGGYFGDVQRWSLTLPW
ncbi:MAG: PorV/PorQ family protein [Candidatus Eisenbacteria bacterium]|nr:PorV/PorQ family protein [Candidatus Eisenbacteria bacterium]